MIKKVLILAQNNAIYNPLLFNLKTVSKFKILIFHNHYKRNKIQKIYKIKKVILRAVTDINITKIGRNIINVN